MDRMALSRGEYSTGENARVISVCTDMLQEAADFAFSLPKLESGKYIIQMNEDQPGHRLIVGDTETLRVQRPYMVGFYGIRSSDPGGELSEKLISVDNRLIESLEAYGVGFYNTARWQGEYINTAIFRDKSACEQWGAENSLHQAAVDHLTPRCYQQVLKFTGYVDGWHADCRIDLDEVLMLA